MQTTSFNAPDIECEGCANAIRTSLERVTGVVGVSVDVPTKTVTVSHEAGVEPTVLAQTLDRAGFPVT